MLLPPPEWGIFKLLELPLTGLRSSAFPSLFALVLGSRSFPIVPDRSRSFRVIFPKIFLAEWSLTEAQ